MNWNLEEFYRLCGESHNAKNYLWSLDKKLIKAKKMGITAIQKWNEYFANNNTVDFESEEYQELEIDIEMYMEAALQFAHSTGDILAQILNATVLEHPLAEHDVSISKVRSKLLTQEHIKNVITSVDEFVQSRCFQYINAFVNIIKHRSLIGSFTHAEFGNNTKNKIGLKFERFKYRGSEYSSEYADEIVNIYFEELQNIIENVGIQINEFLKSNRH